MAKLNRRAEEDDTEAVLAALGGDRRVLKLFEIALTAYKYLPMGMFSLTTGVPTREIILDTIRSFGFEAEPIPWERFPKRFHKNLPEIALFRPGKTAAEIEEHWKTCIAQQTPKPKAKKG